MKILKVAPVLEKLSISLWIERSWKIKRQLHIISMICARFKSKTCWVTFTKKIQCLTKFFLKLDSQKLFKDSTACMVMILKTKWRFKNLLTPCLFNRQALSKDRLWYCFRVSFTHSFGNFFIQKVMPYNGRAYGFVWWLLLVSFYLK